MIPAAINPGSIQSEGPVSGVVFVCVGEYTFWPEGIFSIKGAGVGHTVGFGQTCRVVVPPLLTVRQLPSANICTGCMQNRTIVHSSSKNIFIERVDTLHEYQKNVNSILNLSLKSLFILY